MKNLGCPYSTLLLSVSTLLVSSYVAIDISGSLFAKVRIVQLEAYGGVTFEHLRKLEFWRLIVSQLIHVKQPHMLFNVLSLTLLGAFIERYIGAVRFFFLWFVPGVVGTLLSTLFVSPPWNLGTGASQSIMGIAAFGVLLVYRGIDNSQGLKYVIAFALVPALVLDLVFAHYPKPGHLVGFACGILLGMVYLSHKR